MASACCEETVQRQQLILSGRQDNKYHNNNNGYDLAMTFSAQTRCTEETFFWLCKVPSSYGVSDDFFLFSSFHSFNSQK